MAIRAFRGQGAASGAGRPAHAIRRYKRRGFPAFERSGGKRSTAWHSIGITSRGAP